MMKYQWKTKNSFNGQFQCAACPQRRRPKGIQVGFERKVGPRMNHDRKMSPMSFKSDQKSIPEGSNIDHNSENCPMRDPMRGPSGARKMGPRGVPKSIKNRSPRGPKSTLNRSKRGLESLSIKKSTFGHSEIGPVAIFGGPKSADPRRVRRRPRCWGGGLPPPLPPLPWAPLRPNGPKTAKMLKK